MNCVEIANKYGINRKCLAKHLGKDIIAKQNGRIWDIDEQSFIKWYNANFDSDGKWQKYHWDRTIFREIDTQQKAYWLGFITADGCLHQSNHCLSIDLGAKDESHLRKFIKFIDGNEDELLQYTIHPTTGNKLVHVQLTGSNLYIDLLNIGIFPNKSGKEQYIKTEFDRDYIRGLIDGDGYIRKDLSEIGLVGSYDLLSKVQEEIYKHISVTPNSILSHGSIYRISYRQQKAIHDITEWLYKNPVVSLDRKQKLANLII